MQKCTNEEEKELITPTSSKNNSKKEMKIDFSYNTIVRTMVYMKYKYIL